MDTKLARNDRGFYEVRYAEKRPDGAWVTRRVSCRTKNRTEAEAFRKAWSRELTVANSVAGPGPDVVISELVGEYLKHHEGGTYQEFSLRPVVRLLGDYSPEDLTLAVQKEYQAERSQSVVRATIRRELGALKAALNWCVDNEKLDSGRLPRIGLPPDGQSKENFLDEDQESIFHAMAMGDSLGRPRLSVLTRFVGLALDTAARKGAIMGLTWDRVDLVRGLIDFRDPGVRISRKRRTVVPISDRLMPMLVRAHREKVNRYVLDGVDPRSAFERFVATTPTPEITPHDLRRTWATLAARAGVDLWEIAGVLGDDVATVTKHYAKHRPGFLRGAVNRRF